MNTQSLPSQYLPSSTDIGLLIPNVEPWPEPVDGSQLLDDLVGRVSQYVVLPTSAPEAIALWDVHTYAYELRDTTTYLGVESPEKRCGKTTLLCVLSELVNRPLPASNISSPAFFRVIQELRPTLMIDEADTFLPSNEELRGILNSGYKRKLAYVVRVAHQGPNDPPESSADNVQINPAVGGEPAGRSRTLGIFSCWCPKVISQIGRLPETLADRCIMIRMQRKLATDECERFRNLDGADLKRKCVRFVLDHSSEIAQARPEFPPGLNDRAADIWEPLLAIADIAGGRWPALARQAALDLTNGAQDRSPSGSLLLDILFGFLQRDSERMFSRDLVTWLNGFADRPWMELKIGKEITERWLSQQLRPYGIRPRMLRIGEEQSRGYVESEMSPIFERYISRSEYEAFKTEFGLSADDAQKRPPAA
jgi:hypothetical protein